MSPAVSPFDDPRLDTIFHYWLDRRGARGMPERADIHPGDFRQLVRLLNLVDVLYRPLRFRHRLVGSESIEWLGRDPTGRILDETLYGPATDEILGSLTTIVQEARPYRRSARMDWSGKDWLHMEAAELPLAGEDGTVRMILRGAVFTRGTPDRARLNFTPLL